MKNFQLPGMGFVCSILLNRQSNSSKDSKVGEEKMPPLLRVSGIKFIYPICWRFSSSPGVSINQSLQKEKQHSQKQKVTVLFDLKCEFTSKMWINIISIMFYAFSLLSGTLKFHEWKQSESFFFFYIVLFDG